MSWNASSESTGFVRYVGLGRVQWNCPRCAGLCEQVVNPGDLLFDFQLICTLGCGDWARVYVATRVESLVQTDTHPDKPDVGQFRDDKP